MASRSKRSKSWTATLQRMPLSGHSWMRWIRSYRRGASARSSMEGDALRAKWKQFRNELNYEWTELSSEELDRIDGRRDNLVCLLEKRYGYARRRAEREVERVVTEFEDKLRR